MLTKRTGTRIDDPLESSNGTVRSFLDTRTRPCTKLLVQLDEVVLAKALEPRLVRSAPFVMHVAESQVKGMRRPYFLDGSRCLVMHAEMQGAARPAISTELILETRTYRIEVDVGQSDRQVVFICEGFASVAFFEKLSTASSFCVSVSCVPSRSRADTVRQSFCTRRR